MQPAPPLAQPLVLVIGRMCAGPTAGGYAPRRGTALPHAPPQGPLACAAAVRRLIWALHLRSRVPTPAPHSQIGASPVAITVSDLTFDGPAFYFKLPQNVSTSVTFKVRRAARRPDANDVPRRHLGRHRMHFSLQRVGPTAADGPRRGHWSGWGRGSTLQPEAPCALVAGVHPYCIHPLCGQRLEDCQFGRGMSFRLPRRLQPQQQTAAHWNGRPRSHSGGHQTTCLM